MGSQEHLNGFDKSFLILMRKVLFLDPFDKMVAIDTLCGPVNHRLIMIIYAGVISTNADTVTLDDGIKSLRRECIPSAAENLRPLPVILGKREFVLYLEVESCRSPALPTPVIMRSSNGS